MFAAILFPPGWKLKMPSGGKGLASSGWTIGNTQTDTHKYIHPNVKGVKSTFPESESFPGPARFAAKGGLPLIKTLL